MADIEVRGTTTAGRSSRVRSPAKLLLVGGVLLIILWLGFKTWRMANAAQSLLARQAEVEELIAGGFTNVNPDEAEALVLGIRRDVVILRNESQLFMPVLPYLSWLPKAGPTLAAAPHLMVMADHGTAAAVYALRGLKPALVVLQQDRDPAISPLSHILQVVAAAQPDLAQASAAIDQLVTARNALGNPEALPQQIQTLLQKADHWLPLAQDGMKVAQVMPALIGMEEPRHYLIIAQNEDEMRPTGGFITGGGVVTLAGGRIVDLTFQDANFVDAWEGWQLTKPYDAPPQPLYDFMRLELFLFRDANFWPDFPTSAQKAMDLYSYGQDVPPLDGAIAIDQHFMKLLVEAAGPVPIPEADVTINKDNIVDTMRDAWSIQEGQTPREWLFDRKQFMSIFATAIRARLESDFASVDPVRLALNMHQAITTRHLQIYMRDPEVAAVLAELGWDGRLQNKTGQDLLMVVDTNVGYNKVNPYIQSRLAYTVTLTADGGGQADLTLYYQHNGIDPGEPCTQGTPYVTGITYMERAETCYWDYVRIYAPSGSRLIDATRHQAPATAFYSNQPWDQPAAMIEDPSGLATFANFFLLPWAQSLSSHYTYQLPPGVTRSANGQHEYRLTVLKQAGLIAPPLTVTIQLPPGVTVMNVTPEPTAITGNTVTFVTTLVTNLTFTVTYR